MTLVAVMLVFSAPAMAADALISFSGAFGAGLVVVGCPSSASARSVQQPLRAWLASQKSLRRSSCR